MDHEDGNETGYLHYELKNSGPGIKVRPASILQAKPAMQTEEWLNYSAVHSIIIITPKTNTEHGIRKQIAEGTVLRKRSFQKRWE